MKKLVYVCIGLGSTELMGYDEPMGGASLESSSRAESFRKLREQLEIQRKEELFQGFYVGLGVTRKHMKDEVHIPISEAAPKPAPKPVVVAAAAPVVDPADADAVLALLAAGGGDAEAVHDGGAGGAAGGGIGAGDVVAALGGLGVGDGANVFAVGDAARVNGAPLGGGGGGDPADIAHGVIEAIARGEIARLVAAVNAAGGTLVERSALLAAYLANNNAIAGGATALQIAHVVVDQLIGGGVAAADIGRAASAALLSARLTLHYAAPGAVDAIVGGNAAGAAAAVNAVAP